MPDGDSRSIGAEIVLQRHRMLLLELSILDGTCRMLAAAALLYIGSTAGADPTVLEALIGVATSVVVCAVWIVRSRSSRRRLEVVEEQVRLRSGPEIVDLYIASRYSPHERFRSQFVFVRHESFVWLFLTTYAAAASVLLAS